jgi:pimeloyl-ACP methyl ester carboxylesterase
MSSPKPIFVFIPGAFCPAQYFHKLTTLLESSDYICHALDLPSMNASLHSQGQRPGLYADAAYVRDFMRSILSKGSNIVLVGSSYGGAVSMESLKDLLPDSLESGQIKHLILLGSIMASPGFTIKDLVGGNNPINAETLPPGDFIDAIDPTMAGAILCGSLPKAEQDEYAAMGKRICTQAFLEPLTYAAWKEVETTLVVGSKDLMLPVEKQVEYFEKANEEGAKGARMVRIEGGDHLCMLSHVEEVVRVCLEVAGGKRGQMQ